LADGARCVALRMGGLGSIVAHKDGQRHHIGAVRISQIVDQTGAGNTYCGGLLAGLIQGKGLDEAGAMAAVSASFCLEQVGVLDPMQVRITDRNRRYDHILSTLPTSR